MKADHDHISQAVASAPGKLMLFGDHSVVYGYPCLVSSVSRQITTSVQRVDQKYIEVIAPDSKDTTLVEKVAHLVLRRWGKETGFVQITTQSNFSDTFGLGSSSAVIVSVILALSSLYGVTMSRRELFVLAYECVLHIHGVGSGFDVASAVYGGVLYYQNAGEQIEELNISGNLPIVVGYTGVKADTRKLIKQVELLKRNNETKVRRVFEGITALVESARIHLEQKQWQRLGVCMNYNHEYLRNLGVSSEPIEALVSAASSAGAYGAKISGAGGGDCIIAVVAPELRSDVEQAIVQTGGEIVEISMPTSGSCLFAEDDTDEVFVVVDENDEIIGHQPRGVCNSSPQIIHRAVNVVIFDSSGRVLLQKRSMNKDVNPGMWTISCSGHVEKGETYRQAAERELMEELGVETNLTFHSKYLLKFPRETEMQSLYTGVYEGKITFNTQEIDEVRYMSRDELKKQLSSGHVQIDEGGVESLKRVSYL